MDTAKRGAPYTVCLLIWVANLRRHMCCRAIKTKLIGVTDIQCDQKKSPNVYKNCPKMILLEK